MPRFNINGNLSRMDTKRQQQFENDASQQELDMRQQNGMVGQLAQLYGISNDAQMTPERIAQMQAQTAAVRSQTAGQNIQNDWSPYHQSLVGQGLEADLVGKRSDAAWEEPYKQQKFELGQSQIGATNSLAEHRNDVPAAAIPYLVQIGVMTPEEGAQAVLTPQQQQKRVGDAAKAAQIRAVQQAADAAQQATQPKKKSKFDPRMMFPTLMPTP